MKVVFKIAAAVVFSFVANIYSCQAQAAEILGGGGNAADKLILDWAGAKSGKTNPVKFSSNVLSTDLALLQTGRIDFALVDSPVNEAELNRLNLVQFPFTLSGFSFMVNLQNTLAGPLRLDGATLGKIFSGEITSWDDSAITSLNPKHDLPNKPIIIVHSGESSADYPVISSYLASVNEKWKAGEQNKKHDWPANAVQTDSLASRIAAIKSTPFSISFLPMQYLPLPAISTVQVKNKDGNFVTLSDTSIIASTAGTIIDEARPASMSLINKGGASSWPLSSFTFIVVSKERLKEEPVAQILNIVHHGLKFGSLKPTVHNFVPLPDSIAKTAMSKIEPYTVASAGKPTKASQEALEMANRRRQEEENRQRAETKATAQQDDKSKADERSRIAKQQADEQAREQAIKEARAAKQAAEEAIKAANAAKLEAERIAEKNRQIAKAEKEKADREQAERERLEREKAEKEKAIQLRNQKDEDPLEAYRRTSK